MKLIPTAIKVDNLQHEGFKNEGTGEWQSRAIRGSITIDFVSSGDMSRFISETPNSIRIVGLSERIVSELIIKEIVL